MKDQDGSDASSDSDSDSSDDEDAYNPKFDEAFYTALASLKQKDPRIYDKSQTFFDESNVKQAAKEKKAKALTVKDYEHKILVEKGGIYEDDEDDGVDAEDRPHSPSYVQEQESIRKEFRKVIEDDSEEEEKEDENWGGIFKKREKTNEEKVN